MFAVRFPNGNTACDPNHARMLHANIILFSSFPGTPGKEATCYYAEQFALNEQTIKGEEWDQGDSSEGRDSHECVWGSVVHFSEG